MGHVVSSLVTSTMRVSGLWGLIETGPHRLNQTGLQGRRQTTPEQGKGHSEDGFRGGDLGPTGFVKY